MALADGSRGAPPSESAVADLEGAVRRDRNNPDLIGRLAEAYLGMGNYPGAENAFRKAARVDPRDPRIQLGLAAALGLQGRPQEAEIVLRRLTARFPEAAVAWLNLGHALLAQERLAQALECYDTAIKSDPTLVDAHNNRGRVLQALQRFSEAEASFRRCLSLAPDYGPARLNLAAVAIACGRPAEAETLCQALVSRAPGFIEAHKLLAGAVGMQGRLREALAVYRHIAELAPEDARARATYALALFENARSNDALRLVSTIEPGAFSPGGRYALACALLSEGQFGDGWSEYAHRAPAREFEQKHGAVSLARSLSPGLTGNRVCVIGEQGLGDELFFLRYVPLLASRGACVTYRAAPKLASLVRRAPGVTQVIEGDMAIPPNERVVLAGDLPLALCALPSCGLKLHDPSGGRFRDFPRAIHLYWPHLPPPLAIEPLAEQLAAARAQLTSLGPAPYIGLSWRAGTAAEPDGRTLPLRKEIPLPALGETLRNVAGTLVALQRNPADGDLKQLEKCSGRVVHDLTALNDDLESMLAAVSLIDDYVAVSNTNVHIRAAAGKAARVLVPAPAEWRWLRSGRTSPWFPGSTVYRQSADGSWTRALHALAHDLEARHGTVG